MIGNIFEAMILIAEANQFGYNNVEDYWCLKQQISMDIIDLGINIELKKRIKNI